MKNNNETKLFAFKVAQKKNAVKAETKWTVRNGVSVAGCSGDDARGSHRRYGADKGIYC